MRRSLLTGLLALFVMPVGRGFSPKAFLKGCRAAGIKLGAATRDDSPHGHFIVRQGNLEVTLYEPGEAEAPKRNAEGTAVWPGRAHLPGDPGAHMTTIEAKMKAAGG